VLGAAVFVAVVAGGAEMSNRMMDVGGKTNSKTMRKQNARLKNHQINMR
jgi:hypothetical protein